MALALEELLDEVERIARRARQGAISLEKLQALQEKLLEQLDSFNSDLGFYDSYMPGNAVRDWIQMHGREILAEYAIDACHASPEFGLPAYRDYLREMIYAAPSALIDYTYDSRGDPFIKINMNIIGTLDDWGEAVKAYREEIGYGEDGPKTYKTPKNWKGGNKSPERTQKQKTGAERSAGWARVYAPSESRFNRVIIHREAHSNGAGFWQILDAGTANVKLSSDLKGGYPTPVTPPSRFVDRARREIQSLAREKYDRWEDENSREASLVRSRVNEIQQNIDKISEIINTMLYQDFDELDARIERQYEEVVRRSTSVKNAIKRISEERSLTTITEAEKRQFVTIGYTAEGKRKRTRVSTLKLRLLVGR